MKVRIVKATSNMYWYADCIGRVFDVTESTDDLFPDDYHVDNPHGMFISRYDCAIIPSFDFSEYIQSHREWSLSAFGTGNKTESIYKHIEKELQEIRQNPTDLMAWIDVIILGIDGAWRAGYNSEEIIAKLKQKQSINKLRKWIIAGEDDPIEHDRTGD